MDEVTIQDLRNHGGEIMERVEGGKTLTVTRAGVPVGELCPIPRPRLTATTLLERWRQIPAVDAAAFRADLDNVLDPLMIMCLDRPRGGGTGSGGRKVPSV